LKGARKTVFNVEFARNSGFLFIPHISDNYFNLINEYLRDGRLTPLLQKLITVTSEPFADKEHYFAIDGSGFRIACGKKRYNEIRTDRKAKSGYVGIHIIAGVKSKIIPYAIVSEGHIHDNNFFKPLVLGANKMFKIKEIYADKGYLSNANANFCYSLNIKDYIKIKDNTILDKFEDSVWNNSIKRYLEDVQKGAERRFSLRANVECAFHMIKTVFSDVLRCKTHTGRVNEVLARIVCHNIRCLVLAYVKNDIKFPFGLR